MATRPLVKILGPVTIDGDLTTDPLNPRLRRLLALLAARGGEPIAESTLIDAVWSESEGLPANPTRSLQTYVSRLRSHVGAEAIERLGATYRLVVVAEPTNGEQPVGVEVDAVTFERTLGEAGRARQAGDLQTARRHLDVALALWSGPALGDLASEPWAIAIAHRLDELRLSAQELRADIRIDEQRIDGPLVAELERLAVDHPHREEPTRLLMVALHRSNRQADALAAFDRLRRQLATDLGLEPSSDLKRLEDRILADDDPASSIGGRPLRGYELLERLGEGAFSIVHRGYQASVDRDVAIKQIRAELANRPEFIRGFDVEAHRVARLEHPYIVPLYDYWREPNSAYLVMRYLRGGSLESALRSGPWQLDRVVGMVEQVGSALDTAHRSGIVHRDVKPANVLLDDEGHSYLTDFGIALGAEESADPEAALSAGSPAYAAPEQLRREAVGPPADVHGLAITAYEALTGRLPFPDEPTQAALLKRQLHDPIPAVSQSRGGTSRHRSTQCWPERRPRTRWTGSNRSRRSSLHSERPLRRTGARPVPGGPDPADPG